MDYKNQCPLCSRFFCCPAHRADHEVKNHSKMFGKQKQDNLVNEFQRKAEMILLKSQKCQTIIPISENKDKRDSEKCTSKSVPSNTKPTIKRLYSEINKRILSTSVSVSETRKILVPIHRMTSKNLSNNAALSNPYNQLQNSDEPVKKVVSSTAMVKTSTPILGDRPKEETPLSNWGYISPASTISCYGTPHTDGNPEGQPFFKPQSNKLLITPLRSIMVKSSRFVSDNERGPSPYLNYSKSRRVTFSFSSKLSSTNSSPLESVQEVETNKGVQDKNNDDLVSPIKSFYEKEICQKLSDGQNYLLEVTSTVSSCVEADKVSKECLKNMERYVDDSSSTLKGGGLFSCVTNIFCSAVQTLPVFTQWQIPRTNINRQKRSRSPEAKEPNQSPLQKRRCYRYDLRMNPIKSRKPISNA